jgi:drug/metabolite transporter (DMT)-like permease
LAIAALSGAGGMLCGIFAVRFAPVSTLAPLNYTRLLMATAIGAAWFGEPMTIGQLAGSAVILAACLMATK